MEDQRICSKVTVSTLWQTRGLLALGCVHQLAAMSHALW